MNKLNKIIVILSVLMIPVIFFGYVNTSWFLTKPYVKVKFTGKQIAEIQEKLKFELATGEKIRTEYYPGFMQAATRLVVFVENIESEEDFLSKFKGNAICQGEEEWYRGHYYDSLSEFYGFEVISEYRIEVFLFENEPKDFSTALMIFIEDGVLKARFNIVGYIEDLSKIYSFTYNRAFPVLINPLFMIPLIIEIVLLSFLFIQKFKKSKNTNQQEGEII